MQLKEITYTIWLIFRDTIAENIAILLLCNFFFITLITGLGSAITTFPHPFVIRFFLVWATLVYWFIIYFPISIFFAKLTAWIISKKQTHL